MIFDKIRERLELYRFDIQKVVSKVLEKYGFPYDSVVQDEIHYELDNFFENKDAIDIINKVEAEYNQTVTNADIIRHMTDEELADFLFEVEYRRSVFGNGAKWKSEEDALKYLQEEAER